MAKKYMTQQEFAEHIKKSKQYVSELKSKNYLVFTKSGLINVEKSMATIEKNSDPAKSKIDFGNGSGLASEENNNDFDFNKGRAKEQHFKAEIAKMKALKESDKVIEIELLQGQIVSVFASFKDQLLSIPKRLATPLSLMKDTLEIDNLLSKEINEIINQSRERAKKTIDVIAKAKEQLKEEDLDDNEDE